MHTEKAGEPEHIHRIDVDGDGTGETISTSEGVIHTHAIKNWSCDPSEALGERGDKHTHRIESSHMGGYNINDMEKVKTEVEERSSVNVTINIDSRAKEGEADKEDNK